ncbi:hypothetical protein [Parabacteroides sp.]
MKKQISIIMMTLCLVTTSIVLNSCKDSEEENPSNPEETEIVQLKEGQTIHRQFTYGDKKIDIEDEMVNYGDADTPVLFSVNKKITFDFPGLDGIVFTTDANELEIFFKYWANLYDMPYSTREEKAEVAHSVFNYFITLDIDFHLFVQLVTEGYNLRALLETPTLLRSSDIPMNDVLYTLWSKREEVPVATRSKAEDVIGIIEGVIDLYNVWNDFAANNQPIAEAVEGTCSFLNGADNDASHYSLDNYFISPDYVLSYWVSGIMHSQFTYIVEGYTGKHPSLKGDYIPKCRIRTTYLDVKGAAFIGSGSYKFSPVINVSSTPDSPIVQANGMVQVVYGDCCCFRYFSYLNFSLRGDRGYSQLTFDSGK